MTEEAEKLISTAKEEDKDDASGEKENVNHGETEMKTDTYDLVVLGASGFTGNYSKMVVDARQDYLILQPRPVCGPVRVQGCERAWSNVGGGRFSPIIDCSFS